MLTGLVCQVGTYFNSGTQASSLLFVGACRDGEPGTDHSLAKMLELFESSDTINTNTFLLGGFQLEPLNEMVSEVLCLPRRLTRSLSQIIYHKTQGYPLFVVEFLDSLLTENLITHNKVTGWEWDVDAIDMKGISKSVAELLSLKLQRLPHDVLFSMKVLSCFGSHVDQQTISIVKNFEGSIGPMIIPALHVAQKEGLVEIVGPTVKFTHDLIQQAAFDLIPNVDRVPLLQRLAGCFINQCLTLVDSDSTLFVAVDLINRIGRDAISNNIGQSRLFAELNFKAGKKSMTITDFASAAKYFNSGISFLQGDYWNDQYQLSLGLFENLASSYYCEGNYDEVVITTNKVFDKANSFEDKFKSYCLYIKVLALNSMDEAIAKIYVLLNYLGEKIDPEKITHPILTADAMEVKQMLLGNQKFRILHSFRMTDSTMLIKMKLISMLIFYYNRQRSFMSGFLACRMLRISLKHGHCEDTVFALSIFSCTLINVLRDPDEACSMARASLSMLELHNSNNLIPRVYPFVHGMVMILQDPLHLSLDPLLRACRLAFMNGNFESAMMSTMLYVARSLHCGKKLNVIIQEVKAFALQHVSIYFFCSVLSEF